MKPIGYQLYTSRNFSPMSDTLRLISEVGYTFVEGYPRLFETEQSKDALQRGLLENELTMPASYFSLSMLQNDPKDTIETCKRFGIQYVVLPNLIPALRPSTNEGWRSFGYLISDMAKPIQDAGINFVYHNSKFEFVRLPNGDFPFDLILEADSSVLIELDPAWIVMANNDPLEWLLRYAERVHLVHVKDIATPGTNINEDGWADIGYGIMNWKSLWAALDAVNVKYRILEHENLADHWRFCRRSMAAIRDFER